MFSGRYDEDKETESFAVHIRISVFISSTGTLRIMLHNASIPAQAVYAYWFSSPETPSLLIDATALRGFGKGLQGVYLIQQKNTYTVASN